ncbi:MAG: hypothetical protein QM684_10895 [Rhizobium sp.]
MFSSQIRCPATPLLNAGAPGSDRRAFIQFGCHSHGGHIEKRNKQTVKFIMRNIHSIFQCKGQQQILGALQGGKGDFARHTLQEAQIEPTYGRSSRRNGYSIDLGTGLECQ